MSSWGKNDNAANSPYWAVSSVNMNAQNAEVMYSHPDAANVARLYGNTTAGVYTTGATVGLFMINATETTVGGDNVADVSIANTGAGYVEVPGVSFTGGAGSGAAATATIAGGVVTNIAVTNTGLNYTSDPTVVIAPPVLTVPTSGVTIATDLITYTAHGQANTAALTYANNSSTTLAGLTDGTTYYVGQATTNTFKLYNTSANAASSGATGLMDLTGTGNNGQYFTIVAGTRATAIASRGLSQSQGGAEHATHTGWNLKTVGTGGRAGRVTFETLVAISEVTGDGSDDISLPDA